MVILDLLKKMVKMKTKLTEVSCRYKKSSLRVEQIAKVCGLCGEDITYCYQCGSGFHDSDLTRINDGESTCSSCLEEKRKCYEKFTLDEE